LHATKATDMPRAARYIVLFIFMFILCLIVIYKI